MLMQAKLDTDYSHFPFRTTQGLVYFVSYERKMTVICIEFSLHQHLPGLKDG